MTTATRILLVQARPVGEPTRTPAVLGVLRLKADGWHFDPWVAGRNGSRVGRPTWEKAIPRWTGGLDRTESRAMRPSESVKECLERFDK